MKKIYNYLPILLYLSVCLVILFLSKENFIRALIIFLGVSFWFVYGFVKKNYSLSSLITLIFFFPFNITIQLNNLGDPYVNNVIVNYLIPFISIIDLFSLILIFSYWYEKKILKLDKKIILILSLVALSILLHPTILGLISLSRIFIYAISGIYILRNLDKQGKKFSIYTLLLAVFIQGLIVMLQVSSGSVLGLTFLGESQLVSGSIGSSFISLGGRQILRGYGTFPHPNVLAGFLLFSLFLMLLYFNKRRYKKLFVVYGLILFIIVSTFSRLHIGLAFLMLTFSKIGIYVVIGFMSGGLILLTKNRYLTTTFIDRFLNIFGGSDISANERISLFNTSLNLVSKNPFGLGWGQFITGLKDYSLRTQSGILLLQPVHNIFMLLINENGIILGLLLSILIIYSWIKRFLPTKNYLYIFAFVSLLIIALFDHYLLTLPQGLFILILSII